MSDTQANEHFTPKPLHEHVPGAWNFVEPNPRATPSPRLALSAQQREKLLEAMRWDAEWLAMQKDDPDSKAWRDVEDALVDILMPRRYVTGIDQTDWAATDPSRP